MVRHFCFDNGEECSVFNVPPGLSDLVDPDFADGWLCFDRGDERRRLAPIPVDWENLPDGELSQMWARAKRAPRIKLGLTPDAPIVAIVHNREQRAD
jgi:hypothetical protein